jgi:hypothetical protein
VLAEAALMVPDTRSRLEAALADLEAVLVRAFCCGDSPTPEKKNARADLVDLAFSPPVSLCSVFLHASHDRSSAPILPPSTPPPKNTRQDAVPADSVDADDLTVAQDVAAAAKAKLAAA